MLDIIQKGALLTFSVVICLLAGEGYVRLADKAPVVYRINPEAEASSYQLSENPILGYELKPSFKSPKPNHHQSFAFTNSHGQRDIERSIAKNNKRIILLGDSVVIGQDLKDLNQTISRQLETQLEDIEVLNFGISGYCTRAEVELLRTKGLKFNPDAVVLVFVENDWQEQNGTLIRGLAYTRPKLANELFIHSHLFRFASLRLDLFNFNNEFGDQHKRNDLALGESNVEHGIALLKLLSEQHNFKVLIAIWPSFDDRHIYHSEDQFEDRETLRIEAIASQHQLPTLRLKPLFKQHNETHRENGKLPSPRWLYTNGDGMHPSRHGARIAAKLLTPALAELVS